MDCRVKPGNDEVFDCQRITVMAGLDPAIHGAAPSVKIGGDRRGPTPPD
jgi:hypothetical protein